MYIKYIFGLIAVVVIYWLSMSKIPDLLSFIEVNHKPDDNPPWYFILNDLKKSIAPTIGIIFSLLFILIFSNRNYKGFYSLILFCIIFFGKSIGDGINILINTTNIFNTELAQTSWETQAAYLSSP